MFDQLGLFKLMKNFSFKLSSKKISLSLLALALIISGISAQAVEVLNTPSGGYLICVNPRTAVTTYPAKSKCPSGYKKLILGAQGEHGVQGIQGVAGANGGSGPTGATGTNATLSCAQGGVCVVGNTGPGGGIVFYVHEATAAAPWRYLEAAPNTWSGGVADPFMKWCSVVDNEAPLLSTGDTSTVHTLTTIGSGFSNTRMMLQSCTYGAANMAASYNGGGKSDWFLPSKAELNELYSAKATVGGFQESFYWTSFEASAGNAYYKHFQNGDENFRAKSENNYVRPIRAF